MKLRNEQDEFNFDGEKFWQQIGNFLRYGIPSHDKRGHSSEIRFRVRPVQLDIIGKIREQLPDNLFKTNASLYRGLLAVGCKCVLEYLAKEKDNKKINEVDRLINGLNRLSKEIRLKELEKDIEYTQQDLLRSCIEDKGNVIELLDKMKQDLHKIQSEL